MELAPDISPPSLSAELERVAKRFQDGPVQLAELAAVLGAHGSYAFLAVLALPFLSPVPLLGLATPAGMVVVVIGLQIALGRPPHLPATLATKVLPPRFLPRLLQGASRLLRWVERVLHPRWGWVCDHLARPAVNGLLLAVAGLLLLLPIPVPLSNALPAAAILLLSVAALMRDGFAFLAGCLALLVAAGFLAAVVFLGWGLLDWLSQ
jgi:hypothetical protein